MEGYETTLGFQNGFSGILLGLTQEKEEFSGIHFSGQRGGVGGTEGHSLDNGAPPGTASASSTSEEDRGVCK